MRPPSSAPRLPALLLLLALLPLAGSPAAAAARRSLGDRPQAGAPELREGGSPGLRGPGARPPREPLAYPVRSRVTTGRAGGHILVRFAASVAPREAERLTSGLGGRAYRPARFGRFARVTVPPGSTPEQVASRFRGHPSVLWAEVDPVVRAAYQHVTAAAAPSDPLYARQWHFQRIGVGEALDVNPNDGDGVIVAVVDSGVAFGGGTGFPARTAPDLEGTRFLPGLDLVNGGPAWDEGTGDADDPNALRFGHGTFVASIIAATVNNGMFGASVAPRVTILPVRVLGRDGFGSTSDVAEGIHFAIAQGARVVNLSLGATQGSSAMSEAVAAARQAGVVVVAAAGNEAEDELFDDELGGDVAFPARYEHVLAVGATDFADQRAVYSNFGPSLDLVAPGGGDNEFVGEGIRDGILATSFLFDPRTGEALYGAFWGTGTSFSAPHVAGAAALLISLGVRDPQGVRVTLQETTRDLGAAGFDEDTGHGRLDAAQAHRGLGFTF
jgi:serine protease